MQQKVENYIQKHQLLTFNKPIIVGVSGGTDSMVLLHLLVTLGYKCIVAHCNFHLRMEESDRDELFVHNYAKIFNLPYYNIDFQTTEYAAKNKISIEMAARDLRYDWFKKLMVELGAQAIAVAHHADDNIETLLMNLVRGTGFKGLTGIQPRNENIVRPLLCLSRNQLEEYLTLNDLNHIEDSSNNSSDYKRNKFRNEVLPLLTEINPSIRQTLYETIERFNGSYKIFQQAIDSIKSELVHNSNELTYIDIQGLNKQIDIPVVMYEILSPYGFTSATIEQVTEQLNAESGKTFYSDSHCLLKDRNQLIIKANNPIKSNIYLISQSDIELENPFKLKITKQVYTKGFKVSKAKNCVHIDASKLTFPLILRHWEEGDSFIPYGMTQRKKLSDFFIDNKLSLFEKEACWLLTSANEIVWVIGQRVDNRFAVDTKTTDIIEFKF